MPEKSSLLALAEKFESQPVTVDVTAPEHNAPEAYPIPKGYTATAEVFSKTDGVDSPVTGVVGTETYRERYDRLFGAGKWEIHQESPVVMRVIVAEAQHYTPAHAHELGGEALRHAS